jgi:putative ABC transport system permease protein
VLGSGRAQLICQFLTESLMLNLISFLLALLLIYILRPFLYKFFLVDFTMPMLLAHSYGMLFFIFLVVGALLSGLYPAFFLSSLKPVTVLKGKLSSLGKGLLLRKSLVVFQFTLSVLLIIGTIIVYQQVHFMLNQDIGIKVDQVMVLDRPGRWDSARSTHNMLVQRFKDGIAGDPAIESIGMSDEKPGKEIRWPTNFRRINAASSANVPINTTLIDEGYIPTLGLHLLAGRNFSLEFKTDNKGVILSESAVKLLGFSEVHDAIGKELHSDDGDYTVVGVVNDFHQLSLQQRQTPSAFQFGGRDLREFEYYLIKLNPAGIREAATHIRAAWMSVFKDNPFDPSFLDETFNLQYHNEIQFGVIFAVFTILAIFIACIGLFALIAFIIRQRTSEIGIRKVLGANIRDIVSLLAKDFVWLILLSDLIAMPLGWLLMNNWLKDFAYRIPIHWWVFIFSGAAALGIAALTICSQAIKAALANPVKSLKNP